MSLNKFRKFNLVDEQKKNFFRSQISSWLIEHPSVNPYTFTWEGFSRKITSRFRMLPSFLIIGGAKCGTTSLYAHLIEHPNILSASIKEVNFFQYIQNTKNISYILRAGYSERQVIFSFKICDPLSFLYPVKFINEQSKLLITRNVSLNVKFNFCSIA